MVGRIACAFKTGHFSWLSASDIGELALDLEHSLKGNSAVFGGVVLSLKVVGHVTKVVELKLVSGSLFEGHSGDEIGKLGSTNEIIFESGTGLGCESDKVLGLESEGRFQGHAGGDDGVNVVEGKLVLEAL